MAAKKRRKKAGKRAGKKTTRKKATSKKRPGKKRSRRKKGPLVTFTKKRPAGFVYLGTRDEAIKVIENALKSKPSKTKKGSKNDICRAVVKKLMGLD